MRAIAQLARTLGRSKRCAWGWGLALGALVGCDLAGPTVRVDLPRGAGARAALIADLSGPVALQAVELETPGFHLELALDQNGEGQVQALTYPVGLEALRLAPGVQGRADASVKGPLELGEAPEAWTLTVGAERGVWTPIGTEVIAAGLRDFPLQRILPSCTQFGGAAWSERLMQRRIDFVSSVGGQRGWVGVSDYDETGELRLGRRLFEADPSGLRERATPLPSVTPTAAFRDGSDLYVGAEDGSLWRLDTNALAEPPVQLRAPDGWAITALSGGRRDGVFELVSLSNLGAVQFMTGGTDHPPVRLPDARTNVLGWAEPGLAFVRSSKAGAVLAVSRDAFVEEVGGGGVQLMNFQRVEALDRFFAGSESGQLYSRDGDRQWRQVDPHAFGWWVLDIEPISGGLFALLASGSIVEYQPDRGYCEDVSVLSFLSVGGLAALDDGSLLVTGSDFPLAYAIYLPRVDR